MVDRLAALLAPDTEGSELRARADDWSGRLDAVLAPDDQPRWNGRTLIVYGREPIGAFGTGTYLDDVLRHLGATNAVEAEGWPALTLEDVGRLDPPAVIIVRGSGLGAGADPLGPLRAAPIEAIRTGRWAVLEHPGALVPSTALPDVATSMRAILREWAAP